MDIPSYLARIGYGGSAAPDRATLGGLQPAHLLSVPFENLDIGLGRPIRLGEQALWNKIILNRRGGFCYELNGLFAWLLKQIGFDVSYLNARVFDRQGRLGIHFDHLALLVQIPGQSGRWLADVGFGDSFSEPLRVDEAGEQVQGLRAYRLERSADGCIVWQRDYDGAWERQYFFDLVPRRFPREYERACRYHQTSPNSSFTRGPVISLATPEGRITLEQKKLIVTKNGRRAESRVDGQQEFNALLKEHFGIDLKGRSR
jgi:N-hydroxyarylamine O-acetyltransferase